MRISDWSSDVCSSDLFSPAAPANARIGAMGNGANISNTWDGLAVGVSLATLDDADGYGAIEDGALGWRDGVLAYVGTRGDLPAGVTARATHDFAGGWITPGLVDCHTHLVFAGNRAGEFEMRLPGADRKSTRLNSSH